MQSFLTATGLVLLLELGDKTQLLVLTLSARTGHPVPVFAGSALALVAVSALGAAAGGVLLRFVPEVWLSRVAGAVFILVGLLLVRTSLKAQSSDAQEGSPAIREPKGRGAVQLAVSTFGLLFLAEMGDKSQISVVTLTAETEAPVAVFLGAALALTLLTLAAVLAGRVLVRLMPTLWLHRASAAVFIALGVLTVARAW